MEFSLNKSADEFNFTLPRSFITFDIIIAKIYITKVLGSSDIKGREPAFPVPNAAGIRFTFSPLCLVLSLSVLPLANFCPMVSVLLPPIRATYNQALMLTSLVY